MQTLSRKFTVALVATFVFSLLFSIIGYTEYAQQYFSFSMLLLTLITISAPMFLIGGVLASYVIEKHVYKSWQKFSAYVVLGALLILPYCLFIFQSVSLRFALLGAFGAMLFYAVQKIFYRYIFKA